MAQVTDFTGTYDYEREEAKAVAESMLESWLEGYYTPDQYHQAVIKERAHWAKCLDEQGMKDFADEFNKRTADITGVYL